MVNASAELDVLERPGVNVRLVGRDLTEMVEAVLTGAGHLREGDGDFGWKGWAPAEGGPHLLVTCRVSEMWQAMPGQAVRAGIAQHLTAWADVLAAAGLGVAMWGRGDQLEALIVALDQASADVQAAIVGPYLAELNR